jgi:16S rRNA (cytosine967-C5)-methyltransferase
MVSMPKRGQSHRPLTFECRLQETSAVADSARDVALEVLRRVFTQGAFAGAALRAELDKRRELDDRDRGLATELVYGVLRRRAQLDRAIGALGKRLKDLDPKLHDLLRLSAYQLLFLDRIPEHAAVDTAVEQARGRRGERGAAQANAILRKLAAIPRADRLPKPPPIERDPVAHVAEIGSLPRSIAAILVADLGVEGARDFALASLERAPLVLRANPLRTTKTALIEEVGGTPGAHDRSVVLPEKLGALPADLLSVEEGRATPQDEGSMRVIDLLAPEPGDRVLDVCAAPGGKTTDIAERMSDRGKVIAHDRSPEKLDQVRKTAKRLGLSSVEIAAVLPSPGETPFDRVLVDAPCSGLGTLRRHPEIRWRFREEDLERLVQIQRSVLAEGAARVRPGGILVYSVCTVTAREGIDRIRALEGFEVQDVLRTSPDQPGAPDGFFAARLLRVR